MQVFSTDEALPNERFAYWRDVLTRHFIHLRPEPVAGRAFTSTIRARDLGGHSFSHVDADRQRIHRARPEIARSPYDLLFVNLQVRGHGSYRQGADEIALRPGDLFLIDALTPFELGCPEPLSQISLKVPRASISKRLRKPDAAVGAFVPASSYVGALLGAYVAELWRLPETGDAADAQAVAHLIDLAAYELNRRHAPTALPRAAARAALYARAQRLIAHSATQRELTPTSVATSLAVSLRTLQAVFAERGGSIARQIHRERLAAAARLLGDPAWRGRTIAEIAFMAGFVETAHFTHSFVRAYGEPPRAWRRRAAEADGPSQVPRGDGRTADAFYFDVFDDSVGR